MFPCPTNTTLFRGSQGKSNLFGMKFSIQPLRDVSNVNDFRYATELECTVGDPTDLYFQLVDQDKLVSPRGYTNAGLRYVPPALSTLQITFKNIDDSKVVTRFASQPYSTQDPSIWKVSILATDPISGTVNCKFVLTEPVGESTLTRTASLKAVFLVSEAQ